MLTLDEEQEALVQRLLEEPTRAALNASEPGTGKTLCTVEFIKRGGFERVLLLVPTNVFGSWKKTFEMQGVTLPWRPIKTSNDTENYDKLKAGEPGLYVIGPEMFASCAVDGKDEKKGGRIVKKGRPAPWPNAWRKVKPDLVVYDEGHKGMTSKKTSRYKALSQLPKNTGMYKLALSGTPQGSKFTGMHALTHWLWPERITANRYLWEKTWCRFDFSAYSFDGRKAVGEAEPGAYVKTLPCFVKIVAKTLPTELTEIRVDLTEKQREMWDDMAKKSIVWLGDQPEVAALPIVQRIRLRQMALGEVTFNEDGEIDFADDCESSKLRAAQWVIDKHPGEKVLFVTDSAKFAKVAAKRLGGEAWTGETKKARRQELLDNMPNVLVATYAAIAEGVDQLQSQCHIECVFNVSDSPVLNTQFSGRLNRRGQKAEKILRYEIIAKQTADDDHFSNMVDQLAQRKKEVTV